MNYIKDIADALNPYSNLLIAVLTITIVYLTFRSFRSARDAFRFHALPIFFPKISVTAKDSTLILENHSDYPAYDVDLWIVGEYSEYKVPYKSLLSTEYKKIKINFSKSLYGYKPEHYGVVDRIIHYAFPPKTRCTINLQFVLPPETISFVLQFRDSIGYNYLYQSWLFMDMIIKEKENLKLGHVVSNFKPAKRIEFYIFNNIKNLYTVFKFTKHIIFPIRFLRLIPMTFELFITRIKIYLYLQKNIRDTLLRSFPSGYQKLTKKSYLVEGRGNFTDLIK